MAGNSLSGHSVQALHMGNFSYLTRSFRRSELTRLGKKYLPAVRKVGQDISANYCKPIFLEVRLFLTSLLTCSCSFLFYSYNFVVVIFLNYGILGWRCGHPRSLQVSGTRISLALRFQETPRGIFLSALDMLFLNHAC